MSFSKNFPKIVASIVSNTRCLLGDDPSKYLRERENVQGMEGVQDGMLLSQQPLWATGAQF
jgi:hypothetical protein